MRIIRFADLKQVPWKNGGGVTREVASNRQGDAIVWRLSIADVTSEGPFSKFEGLRRILTVTQGQGMELVSETGKLQADLAMPVVFDGGLDIVSRLKQGPLRDFNVIYDPRLCHVEVMVWRGEDVKTLSSNDRTSWALHCVAGVIEVNGMDQLTPGDTAMLQEGSCEIVLQHNACGLAVSMKHAVPHRLASRSTSPASGRG
jgi:uncharacterized protein